MRAKIWKKNAVLATVILFVCVAVYLNWHYGKEVQGEDPATVSISAGERDAASRESESDAKRITTAPAVLSAGEEDAELIEDVGDLENGLTISEEDSYFASARLTREQARDASVELLRETVADEDATPQAKDAAYEALNRIAENAIAEAQIEGLVMAKGFRDCVAYISDEGISVVVSSPEEGLNSAHVTQIKDIVIGETGAAVAAIRIVEVDG